MSAGPLVVTYPLTGRSRAIVAEELSGAAEAIYLVDLAPADRAPRESMSAVTAGSPHNSIASGRSSICHDRAKRRPVLNFSISSMAAALRIHDD